MMTMTQTPKLETLCTAVTIRADYGQARGRVSDGDWREKAHGYRVKLGYKGRALTTDFWMGPANTSEPDAYGVLDCLMSDMQAGDQSFDEFCSEFGYDTDSRTAEEIWKACRTMAPKVRRFLSGDLDTFLYSER